MRIGGDAWHGTLTATAAPHRPRQRAPPVADVPPSVRRSPAWPNRSTPAVLRDPVQGRSCDNVAQVADLVRELDQLGALDKCGARSTWSSLRRCFERDLSSLTSATISAIANQTVPQSSNVFSCPRWCHAARRDQHPPVSNLWPPRTKTWATAMGWLMYGLASRSFAWLAYGARGRRKQRRQRKAARMSSTSEGSPVDQNGGGAPESRSALYFA